MNSNGAITAEVRALLTEMVAEAGELKSAAGGSVTDAVSAWLAPQYLLAAREKLETKSGDGRFEVLRTFLHDWAALRRGDHSAARLQLDREELDWQRANSKSKKEEEFREWIQRPEVREELLPKSKGGISPETLKKIQRELKSVMNRRQQPPPRRLTNPAYRSAFERLDAALAKNSRSNDIEKIQKARMALFGCAPGTLEIPK